MMRYSGKYSLVKSLFSEKKSKSNKSLEEAVIRDASGKSYNVTDEMMQKIIDMDSSSTGSRGRREQAQQGSERAGDPVDYDREERALIGGQRAHVMENQRELKAIMDALGGNPTNLYNGIRAFLRGGKGADKSPFNKAQKAYIKSESFRTAIIEIFNKDLRGNEEELDKKDLADGKLKSTSWTKKQNLMNNLKSVTKAPNANDKKYDELKKFLEAGARRVGASIGLSLGREELAGLKDGLENRFMTSLGDAKVSKKMSKGITGAVEELLSSGMGTNFMRKTINAVSQFQLADLQYLFPDGWDPDKADPIGTAEFPESKYMNWQPMPGAFAAVFDIAEGSRGENLGRGEIASYFYFKNIGPPDFASGVFDLQTTGGTDIHVKHLTGDRANNESESIPGKKKALLKKAMEGMKKTTYTDSKNRKKPITKEAFLKYFNKSHLNVRNIVQFLDEKIDGAAAPAARKTGAEDWLDANMQFLNNACYSEAIDNAGVLFFKGKDKSIQWKYVPPNDKSNIHFERTDQQSVTITMTANRALTAANIKGSSAFSSVFP